MTGSPLTGVQSALTNALNTASRVPLLTQNGTGTLGNFNELKLITPAVVSQLKTALSDPANDTPGEVAAAIVTAFGVTAGDVAVTQLGGPATAEIRVNFHKNAARGTLPAGAGLKLDLGLPGLPVEVSATTAGSIDTDLTYSYPFEFGFDPARGGLYVDPTQFAVTAKVAPSPDFVATATVGLLQANLRPTPQNLGLNATVQVSGLALGGTPTYTLTGGVDARLHFQAGFGDPGNQNTSFKFPSLGGNLNLQWAFNGPTPDRNALTVSFTDVGFKLGSFLGDMVRPIFEIVQTTTAPIQPLIDVLKYPLPGLSDLSNFLGGDDVTLLDIIDKANAASESGYKELIKLAIKLVEVTDAINDFEVGEDVVLKLGDFHLNDAENRRKLIEVPAEFGNRKLPGQSVTDLQVLGSTFSDLDTAVVLSRLPDGAKGVLDKLFATNDGINFSFPVLTDPAGQLFPLLLGREANFFKLDIDLHAEVKQSPLPSMNFFGVGLGFKVDFTVDVHAAPGLRHPRPAEVLRNGQRVRAGERTELHHGDSTVHDPCGPGSRGERGHPRIHHRNRGRGKDRPGHHREVP